MAVSGARPITTITLPRARAEQLHELAKRADDGKGISLSELVDRLVNRAIAEGDLPDSTPGTTIWVNSHDLVAAMLGEVTLLLPAAVARKLAAAILEHLDPPTKVQAYKLGSQLLAINRAGKGIVIAHVKEPGATPQKFTTTPGIARDLARQLTRVADEAEKFAHVA